MTLGLGCRGRPRCVAVIGGSGDKSMFYREKFYEACNTLSYSDCRSLAYGLDMSLRQVYNWRNMESFPSIGVVLAVMDWVAAGKPTKLVGQYEIMTSLL